MRTSTFPSGRARALGRPARTAFALLAAVALSVATPGAPARAHTDLVESTPPTGTVLTSPPDRVDLVFSEEVAPDLATVVLTIDGRRHGSLPLRSGERLDSILIDASDVAASASSAESVSSRWVISYRVTSVDGHPIQGTVAFQVDASSSGSPSTPRATSGATPRPGTARSLAGAAEGDTQAGATSAAAASQGVGVLVGLILTALALPLLLLGAVRWRRKRVATPRDIGTTR